MSLVSDRFQNLKTQEHLSMHYKILDEGFVHRCPEEGPESIAASWVIELANGALLSTCCHLAKDEGDDYPNPYTMSFDGGETSCQLTPPGVSATTHGAI